jgi:hypothetical protein
MSRWLEAPLRAESVVIAVVGIALIVIGTGWADGAEASTAMVTGVAAFVFGLLLPYLSGRLKLGPMEGELSPEAVSNAIESGAAKEGLPRNEIEELKKLVQRLVAQADRPAPASLGGHGLADDEALREVGVQCANCGTLMPHENASRYGYGFGECPKCGGTARRLIGSATGAPPSSDAEATAPRPEGL